MIISDVILTVLSVCIHVNHNSAMRRHLRRLAPWLLTRLAKAHTNSRLALVAYLVPVLALTTHTPTQNRYCETSISGFLRVHPKSLRSDWRDWSCSVMKHSHMTHALGGGSSEAVQVEVPHHASETYNPASVSYKTGRTRARRGASSGLP